MVQNPNTTEIECIVRFLHQILPEALPTDYTIFNVFSALEEYTSNVWLNDMILRLFILLTINDYSYLDTSQTIDRFFSILLDRYYDKHQPDILSLFQYLLNQNIDSVIMDLLRSNINRFLIQAIRVTRRNKLPTVLDMLHGIHDYDEQLWPFIETLLVDDNKDIRSSTVQFIIHVYKNHQV